MNDFVLQMMDASGIFEESQNECAAQKQIEHDKQMNEERENDGRQIITVSATETPF